MIMMAPMPPFSAGIYRRRLRVGLRIRALIALPRFFQRTLITRRVEKIAAPAAAARESKVRVGECKDCGKQNCKQFDGSVHGSTCMLPATVSRQLLIEQFHHRGPRTTHSIATAPHKFRAACGTARLCNAPEPRATAFVSRVLVARWPGRSTNRHTAQDATATLATIAADNGPAATFLLKSRNATEPLI